jgi:hypothetical protein
MDRRSKARGGGELPPVGEHHGGSFGIYMAHKKRKLHSQFDAQEAAGAATGVMAGVCAYVNGYTQPPFEELKVLLGAHGGRIEMYLTKLGVTHVVATNLPDSKVKEIRAMKKWMPVVYPNWIVDSIAAGHKLPLDDYILPAFRHLSHAPLGFPAVAKPAPNLAAAEGNATPSAAAARYGSSFAAAIEVGGEEGQQADVQVEEAQQRHLRAAAASGPRGDTTYIDDVISPASALQLDIDSPEAGSAAPTGRGESRTGGLHLQSAGGIVAAAAAEALPSRSSGKDPRFMQGYFTSSRLHYIGSARAHVQSIVAQQQNAAAGRVTGAGPQVGAAADGAAVDTGTESGVDFAGALDPGDELDNFSDDDADGDAGGGGSEHDTEAEGAGGRAGAAAVSSSATSAGGVGNSSAVVQRRSDGSVVVRSADASRPRVIVHVDIDCFFAQVALLDYPHLRDLPVVVAHTGGSRPSGSSARTAFGDGMDTKVIGASLLVKRQRQEEAAQLAATSAAVGAAVRSADAYNPQVHDAPALGTSTSGSAPGAAASTKTLSDDVRRFQASVSSRAEVSSANYPARAFGIHAGMSVGTARTRCPQLLVMPYDFERIQAVSEAVFRCVAGGQLCVGCDGMCVCKIA